MAKSIKMKGVNTYILYVVFGSISSSSGCIYAHLVQTNKYMSIRSKIHTKTS